jgi:hypothetical protein
MCTDDLLDRIPQWLKSSDGVVGCDLTQVQAGCPMKRPGFDALAAISARRRKCKWLAKSGALAAPQQLR